MAVNMGSICRLCLHKNESDAMKNIFEFVPNNFELNLTEILYWIFDVEIVVEDSYSKLICYKCLNVIESIGRYRQFFQVNQTFLHDRRCPTDYEVKTGWYNTRDIGTNTEPQNSDFIKISLKDLNALNNPQVHVIRVENSNSLKIKRKVGRPPRINQVVQQNVEKPLEIKGAIVRSPNETQDVQQNVEQPLKIKKKVGRPPRVNQVVQQHVEKSLEIKRAVVRSPEENKDVQQNAEQPLKIKNKVGRPPKVNPVVRQDVEKVKHNSEGVPLRVLDCVLPQVALPHITNECLKQGYVKVQDSYYKLNKHIPFVKLKKIECDKLFLKRYKRIGEYTFKKIPRLSAAFEQKMKLICEYYYQKPTSALRELITETSPRKHQNEISINSLVTTNEIHVHVCEYCSKVFKHRHNLSEHCLKIHQKLLKPMRRKSCKNLLFDSKSDENNDSNNYVDTFAIDIGKESVINHRNSSGQEDNKDVTNIQLEPNFADKRDHEGENISNDNLIISQSNFDLNVSSNTKPDDFMSNEKDPLDIPLNCPEREYDSDVEINSSAWLRVKDLKQLQSDEKQDNSKEEESTKDTTNFHMDYLKTVIFGESSEVNPKVTYHEDSARNIEDHNLASNCEKISFAETITNPVKRHPGRPSKRRISEDIVNVIRKRIDDIKKTRKTIELCRKMQFALYNEIENSNIESSLKTLQEKLPMSEMI